MLGRLRSQWSCDCHCLLVTMRTVSKGMHDVHVMGRHASGGSGG